MPGPHDIEVDFVAYCSRCGEELEHDGDSYWHRDPALNRCDGFETYEQSDARQCILAEAHDGECDFGGAPAGSAAA